VGGGPGATYAAGGRGVIRVIADRGRDDGGVGGGPGGYANNREICIYYSKRSIMDKSREDVEEMQKWGSVLC
jgi:hypothetical protein